KLAHYAVKTAPAHVNGERRIHFAGKIKPIRMDVGEENLTGLGPFLERRGHATDWSRAGDAHVFADALEREGGVTRVSERARGRGSARRCARFPAPELPRD